MPLVTAPDNCYMVPRNTIYGLSAARVAHAVYSFAVDGGLVSTIIVANNFIIPSGSIIYNASINTTTGCTSGGAGTLSVGLTSPSSITSLCGATAIAQLGTATFVQSVPVPQTATTWLKTTAVSSAQVAIGTAALTAGVVEIYVFYFESST